MNEDLGCTETCDGKELKTTVGGGKAVHMKRSLPFNIEFLRRSSSFLIAFLSEVVGMTRELHALSPHTGTQFQLLGADSSISM